MDTVARYGGDEFVVVLGHLDLEQKLSEIQAGQVAEKIRASLARSYVLAVPQEGGGVATIEHYCTVSMGIALFFNHEGSEEDVLKRADLAMYNAKQAGRNAIRFFALEE